MRRSLLLMVPVMVMALTAPAFGAVQNNAHNFTTSDRADYGTATGTGTGPNAEQCKACHIPHRATTSISSISSTGQTIGGKTLSDLIWTDKDYGVPTDAGWGNNPGTLLCMSCHDGTIGSTAIPSGDSSANLGTTPGGNHPVNKMYPGTNTGGWKGSPTQLLGVKANDTVTCGTCHDPHESTNTKMLRADNRGSQLCLDCHAK